MRKCPNGHDVGDDVKYCPQCGNPLNDGITICSKCGAEFSNKAKFCPKCGNPTGSSQLKESGVEVSIKQDGKFIHSENVLQDEMNSPIEENNNKGKKLISYGAFAIIFIAACYILGLINDDKTNNEGEIQQTEQIQETTINSPTNNIQEDNSETQKDAEFQRKIMEYGEEIQQIMTQMNNILNGYAASRSYGPVDERAAVNAFADIGDLHSKGARIFDKMIDLARKYNYKDAIEMLKQEKRDFDETNMRMQKIIHDDLYN
jgi:uncharacterized membrane protein YvbJ